MIAGLVLAAGAGSRLGQPKAPLMLNGERLVDRAVRVLREGGCDEVFVVLGAWRGDVPNAVTVSNEHWESGLGSSLSSGLSVLEAAPQFTAAVVTLVDLPGITPAAVRSVVEQPGELVVAVYGAQQGHPLKLGRGHWGPILEVVEGDLGARGYLRGRSDVVRLDLTDLADSRDIDTEADLRNFTFSPHSAGD